MAHVLVELSRLRDVVKNDIVKYDESIKNVNDSNTIDTGDLVEKIENVDLVENSWKTEYNTKIN